MKTFKRSLILGFLVLCTMNLSAGIVPSGIIANLIVSFTGAEPIQFQDLRGVECYPEPDQLIVCGPADTVPILLFTKAEDPIFDVILTIEFEEGLEYTDFAYVESGNADLDTINVDNPENVTFYLDQISQDTGGVVIYIGVSAVCGVDYDDYMPGITFTVDYVSGGQSCSDSYTPSESYATNVIVPEIAWNGTPSPDPLNIGDINEDACVTIDVTSITPEGPVREALLTISDYGDDSVTVSAIRVNGEDVMFMSDPMTGITTANIDGTQNLDYWGGDGQLTTMESIPVEVCYQIAGCVDFVTFPNYNITTACGGEVCGASSDNTSHQMKDLVSFGAPSTLTYELIQTPEFCFDDGMTQGPIPYIYEVSFTADLADPIRGDQWNLIYRLDTCVSSFLELDSVYLLDGPGGNFVAAVPSSVLSQSASGLSSVSFRSLDVGIDLDGPGVGLDDIDGDGVFDDIHGGETIYFRVEMLPSCSGEDLSCTPGGGTCDFTSHRMTYSYNCGRNGRADAEDIDDGEDPYSNNSTAMFSDPDSFFIGNTGYAGYDFGQFGDVAPLGIIDTSTQNIEFSYDLQAGDYAQCPGGTGDYSIQIVIVGRDLEIEDFFFTNVMFEGMADAFDLDTVLPGRRLLEINVGAGIPAMGTLTFDANLDSADCAPVAILQVSAFMLQDCDGCDCQLSRACGYTTFRSDPEDDNISCVAMSSCAEVCRVSTGYTDRSLETKVPISDVSAQDKAIFIPGDTIEVTGYIAIDIPELVNIADSRIGFDFRYVDVNGISDPRFDVMRPEMSAARLQEFTLERADGSSIDLGSIPIPGDLTTNSSIVYGANVGAHRSSAGTGSDFDPTINHPGISSTDWYLSPEQENFSTDFSDGNSASLRFRSNCPYNGSTDQDAVGAFFNHIGGAFLPGDTVKCVWHVPIILTPEFLANGDPSILPGNESFEGSFEFNGFYNYFDQACGLIGASSSPRKNGDFTMVVPEMTHESRIEYIDDCNALMTQVLRVENAPGVDTFVDEFRPVLGLEDLKIEIPMPFYASSIMMTHGDQGPVAIVPDSLEDMTLVNSGGIDYYVPSGPSGFIYFIDAEKANGVREGGYTGWDAGDNDNRLSGGTYPMLGVGKTAGAAMGEEPDSLVITIQLSRACGSALMGDPIESTLNASYRHIPTFDNADFHNTSFGYSCNDAAWYGAVNCDGLPTSYWPYNRLADGNPHHFFNDEVSVADMIGMVPVLINGAVSNDAIAGIVVDGGGAETTTVTIQTNDMPEGGFVAFCVDNAVEIQMIGGMAPVEVGSTDSTTIYEFDLSSFGSPLPITDMDIEVVTDLLYCGPGNIIVKPSLGCSDNLPDASEVLAQSGKECDGITPDTFRYVSGFPDIELDYTINNNQPVCEESLQTIRIKNTGSSALDDFLPTIYLPEGYEASSWEYLIAGDPPAVAIANPAENAAKTGQYGIAFEWVPGTFPILEEGKTLLISFMGRTTCSFVYGSPIHVELNATAACDNDYFVPPTPSAGIGGMGLGDIVPSFSVENGNNEINCAGGTEVLITAINTGKAPASGTVLQLSIPAGITLTENDIEFIAPEGATVENFVAEPIGMNGDMILTMDAPDVGTGGFFCVKLSFAADLECGPVDIGFQVQRTEMITCPGDPDSPCEVQVASGEESFITLEVVPGVSVQGSNVTASCAADPATFDIDYMLEIANPGTDDYIDDITVELYYDVDGNELLDGTDILVGNMMHSLNVPSEGMTEVTGTINVPAEQACKLIMRADIPGCLCGEVVIPVPEILPTFVDELGTDIVFCPNEPFTIEGVCGDYTAELIPAAAGNVTEMGDMIELTLNPGFGVDNTVELLVTSTIGDCGATETMINLMQLETADFGDFEFEVCSKGCQQLDLGIDINLLEDLEVNITPTTYLEDPNSAEPVICDPQEDISYTIEFMLNGQCMSISTMDVTVIDQPSIELSKTMGCQTGFNVGDLVTVTPENLGITVSTQGDGTFTPSEDLNGDTFYTPGPEDIAAGEVTLAFRTDDPSGPCGLEVLRQEFKIILVNCGQFPWTGED